MNRNTNTTTSRLTLTTGELYHVCDPAELGFDTTDELPELTEIIGQARALESIRFSADIRRKGFNLYALGPSGSGKHSVVRQVVEEKAALEPVPPDYCYVCNFADPHKPSYLALPAGRGSVLREDMAQLTEELRVLVPEALEGEEYRLQRQELEEEFRERQSAAFDALQAQGEAQSIRLLRTPSGFAFAPVRDGQVVDPEAYQQLAEHERAEIEARVGELQAKLDRLLRDVASWRREMQKQIKALDRDVVMSVVGQLMDELRQKYTSLPVVLEHLGAVQADLVEHADQFGRSEEGGSTLAGLVFGERDPLGPFFNRYHVNLIVDNGERRGAPVIVPDNPTFPNLVGRVDHQAQFGALITDFTMIKPGALHYANGGYLVLDARKLLTQPYAYEGLKRALRGEQISIESLGQIYSLVSTVSLEPQPIPLNLKVLLVGERYIYYLLCEYDEEFAELFKVTADFDDVMNREADDVRSYAGLLATISRREELKPLDASGAARVIEHASRVIEDSEKLSTRFSRIADLLREADYRATAAGHAHIGAADVQAAIDARERRHARIKERLLEETLRGTLMVATEGQAVGQLNALSVLMLGEHAFGHASRITARVRLGKGDVVDIEREVELGGPIHSKGVLILGGYLSGHYCPERPLSLQASLVFEQTYGGVEGDSASAAELIALLSALAQTPLAQSLAMTGSVNQLGQIQPVGGINEKVEGFFDLCSQRGLTGEQGVVIPRANVKHLMLRRDVVDAVDAGQFHVFAIETVDEALSLLTGLPAGERDDAGQFEAGSVNALVEERLLHLAELAQARNQHGTES